MPVVLAEQQEQVPGRHPFRFCVDVGVRFELHTAAPGKAMLAAMPASEAGALMDQMPFTRFNPPSGSPSCGGSSSRPMRIFSGRSATVTAMPSVPVMPCPT